MRMRSLACGVWTLMLCAAIGCGGDDGDGMTAGDGGMAGTAGMVGGGSGGAAGSGGNSGDGGTVGGGSGGVGGDAGSAGAAGCDQPIEQVPDMDADGFGDRDATPSLVCPGTSGWTERATDCDDDNNAVHPDATEVCDDVDNNCDDVIDEDLRLVSWPDSDMDGFGDASADAYDACIVPPGHATNNEDCGDDDPLVHPGAATERCDGVDTNCDGSVEEIMVPNESIENAIAMAAVGQWICIAPGTYSGTFTIDERVVLVGAGEEPEDTILDGERGGSVITVASQGSGTEIRNLTVRDGGTGWGGGIHFLGHGSLDHVIVEDNHCVGACRGGGVYGSYARNITIRHSIIRNNTTTATPSAQYNYGAGIYVDGNLTLEDSVVEGNVATGANGMSSIQVWGGGLHIDGGQGTLRRVSFLGNEARDGNAVGGGAISTRTTLQLEHVDMRGNSAYGGYVYGTALVTRGGTTNATNIIAAGNHGAATEMFGNAFGTIAATGTGGIALNLTNATLYGNTLSAMNEVRGCALTASGTEATLSFNNVIIESHVCGGGSLIHASHTTPAGSYTSEHDNNVTPGFTGLLTDSASFEDTTGNTAATWDLRLTNGSSLHNVGDPAILDPDGSRSTLGAYGGPGGNWATP